MLQTRHTRTQEISSYELDIQYVFIKYGLNIKDQQSEETSLLALEHCNVYD
jgi:hypothetical protein